MKRRVLALLLAVVMCSAMAVPASAAEDEFELAGGVLTKYNGRGGAVTIPDRVTSIAGGAFYGCTGLTGVTIPDGVTRIGSWAFYGCTGLSSITIPDSVTDIGDWAFDSCTGLTSVTIPGSVTSIGAAAFGKCTGLTKILIDPANKQYTSVDGVVFTNDQKTVVAFPAGRQGGCIIPDGVTGIGDWAFSDCTGLTGVTIPNSVTGIAHHAFYGCAGLTSVDIPNSVTRIESDAFSGCTGLTGMTIPDSVTSMGGWVFYGCTGLTSVTIPDSITNIERYAFYGCTGLTSVSIPSSVTGIGLYAFCGCTGLKDVCFTGTEAQWNAIQIEDKNDPLLSAAVRCNSTAPEQPQGKTALPSNDRLAVDGAAKTPAAYKIDGANYFKLRDVAMLMNGTKGQFSVDHDNATGNIYITTGQPYRPVGGELSGVPTGNAAADVTNNPLYINGEKVDLPVYKIGGANYFKIRELCKALGFNVGYSGDRGMYIESGKPYTDAD